MSLERLVTIIDTLREQCPWDKKQTNQTLKSLTIEEVYELVEALHEENDAEICAELGDVLTHLLFYAKIGREKGTFTLDDVIHNQCEKLIFRHPHIYGTTEQEGLKTVENEADVKANWEQLKLKEGRSSVLGGVPKGLPALLKAYRIQEKASGVGFDWNNIQDVLAKVKEEVQELEEAIASQQQEHIKEELGDVLFSLINVGRFLKVDPEEALQSTNQKFINRFQYIENHINKPLHEAHLEELEALWQEAKEHQK